MIILGAQAALMMTSSTADTKASPKPETKKCPCKDEPTGKPIWIKCSRPDCKQWWHAVCAGFPKTKRTALDSIGIWVCPKCIMAKYSEASTGTSSNSTKHIDVSLLNELKSQQEDIKSVINDIKAMQASFDTKFFGDNISESNKDDQRSTDVDTAGCSSKQDVFINKLARKVVDDHKMLTQDRAEREKNILIFNGPEENNEVVGHDLEFFNKLCENVLEMDAPEVNLKRMRGKEGKPKPIKVCFAQLWDKRKFLSRLRNLSKSPEHKNLHIKHDMSPEDRKKNSELLEKAWKQNQNDKNVPMQYKYKVRGQPGAMKIVQIFSKN